MHTISHMGVATVGNRGRHAAPKSWHGVLAEDAQPPQPPPPLPPAIFDPEALIPAAAEVASLAADLGHLAAVAASKAWHGVSTGARRVTVRWLLLCGCGAPGWALIKGLQLIRWYPEGSGALYGSAFVISCGCASGLLIAQRRDRYRWRTEGGRLIIGGLADDEDDEYAATQRERAADARRLERAMRDSQVTPQMLAALGLANRREIDDILTVLQDYGAELDSIGQTMREAVARAGLDGPPTGPQGWTPRVLEGGAAG